MSLLSAISDLLAELRAIRELLASQRSLDGPLRREQAAEYLQISPRTLEHWTQAGLVPFYKLGDGVVRAQVRYLRSDLDEFMRRRRFEGNVTESSTSFGNGAVHGRFLRVASGEKGNKKG